jgi:hypothetical protein
MKEKARLKAERVIGCVFIIIDLFLILFSFSLSKN